MIATHSIKYNGVWYHAGEEIEEAGGQPTSNSSQDTNPPEKKEYTKTDINRMSTADLQALAAEQGIENADEINGTDLKELLIEKFGL